MDTRVYLKSFGVALEGGGDSFGIFAQSPVSWSEMERVIASNDPDVLIEAAQRGGQVYFKKGSYKRHSGLLEYACSVGAWRCVPVILSHGADPNEIGVDGLSPVMVASMRDDLLCLSSLLSGNEGVDARNSKGQTALMLASAGGSALAAQMLVEQGADVNASSGNGTALHYAAANGNYKCLRTLIDMGADIEAEDHKGCTPLLTAVISGNSQCVQVLLAAGAKVGARSYEEHDAMLYAVKSSNIQLVKLLHSAGASVANLYDGRPLERFAPASDSQMHQWIAKSKGGQLYALPAAATPAIVNTPQHEIHPVFRNRMAMG